MRQYLDYLRNVHESGAIKGDRTGTGTASLFGQTMRFDLQQGFPIVTTKFVPFRLVVAELIWFLSGSTNNEDLRRLNGNDRPTIWEEWALPSGDLGPIYGKQWRHYGGHPSSDGIPGHWEGGVDQIQMTIDMIRQKPNSRRLVISPWNPLELPDESMSPQENVRAGRMALAPCHALFQFYVSNGKLSCQMVQRSADSLLFPNQKSGVAYRAMKLEKGLFFTAEHSFLFNQYPSCIH